MAILAGPIVEGKILTVDGHKGCRCPVIHDRVIHIVEIDPVKLDIIRNKNDIITGHIRHLL